MGIGSYKKYIIMTVLAVVIIYVFVIYLTLPGDIYLVETEDNTYSNYSREDFYTEYLSMVEEQAAEKVDQTSAALSQSVINAGNAINRPVISGGSYDWTAQLEQVKNAYPGYEGNFKSLSVDSGTIYLQEGQGRFWSKCVASNGSTVGRAGCFYFAMSGLITNKTGQIYTVADIIMNGNDSCNNVKLAYDSGRGFSIMGGSMSKVGGSAAMLQQAIDKSPMNARVVSISDTKRKGLTGLVDETKLKQGTWYFLHAVDGSAGILSSGGEHWLLLIGSDESNYYFGNNADRGTKWPKNTIDMVTFNHVWEIQGM